MKSVAQAFIGQTNDVVTVAADPIRLDSMARSPSPLPAAIANQGKIRLGGAFRLPADHKAG